MAVIKSKQSSKQKTKAAKPPTLHDDMVAIADKWLKRKGCQARITDQMRALTLSGEQPDNIGWRDGLSVLIECKTSRSDFLADLKKRFRAENKGVGDWRFYLCPPGVISPEDLPKGWGLLWLEGSKVTEVHGVPSNSEWWSKRPFEGNKHEETILMASALRRIEKAGYLHVIYR